MAEREEYSCWVEVDLGQITSNVAWFCRLSNAQVMAVVKANGYGHGATPIARAALQGGASWLGVARIEEALDLRQANLDCPILLLGYTPPQRVDIAIANQISMAVWNFEQVENVAARARESGIQARLHLKVDTGMSRLGIQPEEALILAQEMNYL